MLRNLISGALSPRNETMEPLINSMAALLEFLECFNKAGDEINGPKVHDATLNAVEVLQKPSPKGLSSFLVSQSHHRINQRFPK